MIFLINTTVYEVFRSMLSDSVVYTSEQIKGLLIDARCCLRYTEVAKLMIKLNSNDRNEFVNNLNHVEIFELIKCKVFSYVEIRSFVLSGKLISRQITDLIVNGFVKFENSEIAVLIDDNKISKYDAVNLMLANKFKVDRNTIDNEVIWLFNTYKICELVESGIIPKKHLKSLILSKWCSESLILSYRSISRKITDLILCKTIEFTFDEIQELLSANKLTQSQVDLCFKNGIRFLTFWNILLFILVKVLKIISFVIFVCVVLIFIWYFLNDNNVVDDIMMNDNNNAINDMTMNDFEINKFFEILLH